MAFGWHVGCKHFLHSFCELASAAVVAAAAVVGEASSQYTGPAVSCFLSFSCASPGEMIGPAPAPDGPQVAAVNRKTGIARRRFLSHCHTGLLQRMFVFSSSTSTCPPGLLLLLFLLSWPSSRPSHLSAQSAHMHTVTCCHFFFLFPLIARP